MIMHNALHPRDDLDRLYLLRKVGGKELAIIEDDVDTSIERLENYKEKHGGIPMTATRNRTRMTRK